ncbi:MAG: hypothetical protein A2Z99_00245 [Treponema sp. GWB1_62_6]|nr:MAG: hypothetical protein A2Z99_00245 [Treponema sp. GWB1_62_6]
MERAILEAFAARYPASAQRRGGRPLRISNWVELLPAAFGSASGRLSFLDAMERLAGAGILALIWKKHREGDELAAAVLTDPRALYERLGLPVPEDLAAGLVGTARKLSAVADDRGDPAAAAFFRFVAERADSLADRLSPRDLADVDALFAFDRAEADRLPIRALSIRLYHDSKRLEALTAILRPLAVRAASGSETSGSTAGGPADPLPLPERTYPEVAIAGNVDLVFRDGSRWPLGNRAITLSLPAAGQILRIDRAALPAASPAAEPAAALAAGGAVGGAAPQALSIENKETFHAFVRCPLGFDFLLCTGGRPNRAVRAVLRVLASSGFSVFHAGDLDADGISILAEAASLCGALPFGMDASTFDRYLPYARDLDPSLVSRLSSVPAAARELPGIRELAERIRETGKGVEQEIIDYGDIGT